jgi:hypothetical protein
VLTFLLLALVALDFVAGVVLVALLTPRGR